MSWFKRVARALCLIGAVGGGIAMFLMMVQVGADVTLKYLFNKPVRYTLEMVSSYYMVAVVFLPLGLVTMEKAHVVVELFTQGLKPRALALVNALASILALVYACLLTWRSYLVAVKKTKVRESWEAATLDIQVWPSRWFLTIGCALMALYLVVLIVEYLDTALNGPDGDDGEDETGPAIAADDPETEPSLTTLREHQALKDPATWSL